MIWLCPLQAKDKRAEQGSLGSGHADGLSLQPQALFKGLQAEAEDCQDAQSSPPGQQEGRHELWPSLKGFDISTNQQTRLYRCARVVGNMVKKQQTKKTRVQLTTFDAAVTMY